MPAQLVMQHTTRQLPPVPPARQKGTPRMEQRPWVPPWVAPKHAQKSAEHVQHRQIIRTKSFITETVVDAYDADHGGRNEVVVSTSSTIESGAAGAGESGFLNEITTATDGDGTITTTTTEA
jgi:hypothetical protein